MLNNGRNILMLPQTRTPREESRGESHWMLNLELLKFPLTFCPTFPTLEVIPDDATQLAADLANPTFDISKNSP